MALNFPNSPTNGQIYYDPTSGNRYVYDSSITGWKYAANNDPLASTSNTQVLYNYQGAVTGTNSITFSSNTLYASNVSVSQNVAAQYYYGNGAYLTGVSPPIDLTAANNYAGYMANSANIWANTVGSSGNIYTVSVGNAVNSYASIVAANNAVGANNWANTKLSNTDNAVFNGSLQIANTLYARDLVLSNSMIANISGNVYDLYVRNNVFIGSAITNVTQLIFNTGTNITPNQPGALTWSQDDSTLHFDTDSPGNVILHIGQDLVYYVKNQTGGTIYKGNVCMFAGTLGASGRLTIQRAIANNAYPSKYVMGVAANDILNGNDGFVVSQGRVRGINTSMFSQGDILYLSPTNLGAMQNTMPSAPNNKITVAAVIYSDASVGSIYVRPTYGSKINEDELAEINAIANGDLLRYNSANGRFENYNENRIGPAVNVTAAFITANAAYGNANAVAISSNAWTNAVGIAANIYAGIMANSSNSYAGAMANSVNIAQYTYTNTSTSAANAWTNAVGVAANSYAGYMANSANNWANTKGGSTVNVGSTTPVGTSGSLWWDTVTGRLYIYYNDGSSSQWVDASPAGSYSLPNTYVTAATYGGATQIPVITVDAQGRINVAANVAVQGMDYAYANGVGNSVNSYSNTVYGGAYVGNNGQRQGPGGSGFGDIFRVHSNTLSTNAYVNTGNNAIAAGPITIAVGQTLTINAGATVVIA